MRFARTTLALIALAALAACGKKDTDPGPGGVTVGEARTLDQAAAMLDARELPVAAAQPGAQASDAMPTDAASDAAR